MFTSPEINELATALSKAQSKMGNAKKTESNPFFKSKYATLKDVWDVIRGPLTENGLSVIQGTTDGDGTILLTRLMHSSGQYVESRCKLMIEKVNAQGMKSAMTLQRRMALESICGVPSEDDDGNASVGKIPPPTAEEIMSGAREPEIYTVPFGQYKDMTIEEICEEKPAMGNKRFGPLAILGYIKYLEESAAKKNQSISDEQKFFKESVLTHLEEKRLDLELNSRMDRDS